MLLLNQTKLVFCFIHWKAKIANMLRLVLVYKDLNNIYCQDASDVEPYAKPFICSLLLLLKYLWNSYNFKTSQSQWGGTIG